MKILKHIYLQQQYFFLVSCNLYLSLPTLCESCVCVPTSPDSSDKRLSSK